MCSLVAVLFLFLIHSVDILSSQEVYISFNVYLWKHVLCILNTLSFSFADHTHMNTSEGTTALNINKLGLSGRFEAWIYQQTVLLRVLWSLTPVAKTKMVRTINKNIRKWLGLPKRPSSADLLGMTTTPLQKSEKRICCNSDKRSSSI